MTATSSEAIIPDEDRESPIRVTIDRLGGHGRTAELPPTADELTYSQAAMRASCSCDVLERCAVLRRSMKQLGIFAEHNASQTRK